jgi:hypothetical protein
MIEAGGPETEEREKRKAVRRLKLTVPLFTCER